MKIELKQLMPETSRVPRVAQVTLPAFNLVKHLCGSIEEGPHDLATNLEHLKTFGE